jgi:hypothetical protein
MQHFSFAIILFALIEPSSVLCNVFGAFANAPKRVWGVGVDVGNEVGLKGKTPRMITHLHTLGAKHNSNLIDVVSTTENFQSFQSRATPVFHQARIRRQVAAGRPLITPAPTAALQPRQTSPETTCASDDSACSSCFQAFATVDVCASIFSAWGYDNPNDEDAALCLCIDWPSIDSPEWVGEAFDDPFASCPVYASTAVPTAAAELEGITGFCASVSAAAAMATDMTSDFATATAQAEPTGTSSPLAETETGSALQNRMNGRLMVSTDETTIVIGLTFERRRY